MNIPSEWPISIPPVNQYQIIKLPMRKWEIWIWFNLLPSKWNIQFNTWKLQWNGLKIDGFKRFIQPKLLAVGLQALRYCVTWSFGSFQGSRLISFFAVEFRLLLNPFQQPKSFTEIRLYNAVLRHSNNRSTWITICRHCSLEVPKYVRS